MARDALQATAEHHDLPRGATPFEVATVSCGYYEVVYGPAPNWAGARGERRDECIAVGLATERFPLRGKQPG